VDLALLPRPANGNVTPNASNGDATPRSFDFSADGSTLYVGTYGGHALAIVPVATFGAATPTYVTLAARSKRTQGVVDLNGKVWFVESSSAYRLIAGMSESNTALSGVQEYADTAIPTSYLPNFRHMTAGQDGNLYLTWSGDGTAPTSLHMFNPTTQTFTALPGPGALPFFPDAIQRSNVAGSTALVFNDLQGLNVGIHDTSTHATTLYPAYTSVTPPVNYANDVVQTTPNDLWLTGTPGYGPDGGTYITPPLIGHIALAAGWSIFPRLTGTMPIYGTGDPNAFLFAIAQSPGSGDTFTVASSATSICTVSTIANYPGDYKVTGVAPGTCTVTVTDQRSRHETLAFQVTTQTATINARARKLQ
ncbi:MAG TPA: Ig-like domain-containing protein, partial [Candidatus Elarobacter sp.]